MCVGGCMGWCECTTVCSQKTTSDVLCSPLSWKTKIGKVRRQNISCHHSRFWLNNVYTFRFLTSGLSSVVFPGHCNEREGTGFCLQIAFCPWFSSSEVLKSPFSASHIDQITALKGGLNWTELNWTYTEKQRKERRRQLSGEISVECHDEEWLTRRPRGGHYSHEIALEQSP